MKTYYERICHLCELKGMTLEELSEKTGITVNHFKHWNRKYFTPKWDLLIKIAEQMNISLEYLAIEESEN